MDPREFLQFARLCRLADTPDAGDRSCVSRAYYATWLVIREYAITRTVPLPLVDGRGRRLAAHERVIDILVGIPDSKAHLYRDWMYNLKTMRQRADYEMHAPVPQSHVTRAIEIAEIVIAWIDSLPE